MTATKTPKTVRTVRIHDVQPGIMLSRDNAYRASQYKSGMWQLEGPNGLNQVCASKRAVKAAVREHQTPKSPRRRRASK